MRMDTAGLLFLLESILRSLKALYRSADGFTLGAVGKSCPQVAFVPPILTVTGLFYFLLEECWLTAGGCSSAFVQILVIGCPDTCVCDLQRAR